MGMFNDIWFLAWVVTYILFLGVCYVAYVSKIVKRLTKPNFYHYHILDTGDNGDFVFNEGKNFIKGIERTFVRSRIFRGTLFYMDGNSEPANMEFEAGRCKYWFDTKETDTNLRQDVLETLLVLRAKELILAVVIIVGLVIFLAVGATWYMNHSDLDSISNMLATIQNQTAPKVIQVR